MLDPARTRRRVRAACCLGVGTGMLTWGNIVFGITTEDWSGRLYWGTAALLNSLAAILAIQEVAVTILWMKLRRADALRLLEEDTSVEDGEPDNSDSHLPF